MAYNHRQAEKKWLSWKQSEENQLRELGVGEEAIQQLRTYDKEQFNRERRYLQRWEDAPESVEQCAQETGDSFPQTLDDLLDNIENEQLWRILQSADRVTLKMLFLRMQGYSTRQIAQKYCLQEMAVINRIARLRKKLKKIF